MAGPAAFAPTAVSKAPLCADSRLWPRVTPRAGGYAVLGNAFQTFAAIGRTRREKGILVPVSQEHTW